MTLFTRLSAVTAAISLVLSAAPFVRAGGGIEPTAGEISCAFPGFEAPVTYPAGEIGEVWRIETADFNGDGALDLAMINFLPFLRVRLGAGDGTFGEEMVYELEASGLGGFGVGDIDGDGVLDLVIGAGFPSRLIVMRGLGDGSFVMSGEFSTGGIPRDIALGDLNGDGWLDITVVNQLAQGAVVLNDGRGGFGPPIPFPTGSAPESLALGDFDDDGDLDAAVVNSFSKDLYVVLNNGVGVLEPWFTLDLGEDPRDVQVADFDGDGIPDLALLTSSQQVAVAIGFGHGLFILQPGTTVDSATRLLVTDFELDGAPDIATNGTGFAQFDPALNVILNNGDGQLAPPIVFPAAAGMQSIAVGDFNGDGRPDVAAGSTSHTIMILLAREPSTACAADLNGDGAVTGADLAALLMNWGPVGETGPADLNHDGVVNGADLALLLNAWSEP